MKYQNVVLPIKNLKNSKTISIGRFINLKEEKIPIRLFMWEWQHTFQISADTLANTIFGSLDKKLQPNVFVVGILVQDRTDRHPICIQPEEIKYAPKLFNNVKKKADELSSALDVKLISTVEITIMNTSIIFKIFFFISFLPPNHY